MITFSRLFSCSAVVSLLLGSLCGAEETEFKIGPDYMDAPETKVREGVPKGEVHQFVMESKDSKIYPGIAKNKPGTVPYQRKVAVYVPAQYKGNTEVPFIIAQDGLGYMGVLPKVLDNMIHEKRLPVMIAVMINSGGGDSLGSERGLEYDSVSDTYSKFIETEVLPKIAQDLSISFTKNPEGRATMGGSSGGAAAFTMAWFHPELYRKVLTYSGTYVDQQFPEDPKNPDGAWEYHKNLIKKSPKKPIRVWLHVSENDNGHDRDEASLHNWVMANERMASELKAKGSNERMASELKAKGYDYRYVFAKAAGHTDGRVLRQTLPEALEWLWRGYPNR
jgi:iron(III)-enterobactin esterase